MPYILTSFTIKKRGDINHPCYIYPNDYPPLATSLEVVTRLTYSATLLEGFFVISSADSSQYIAYLSDNVVYD